MPLEIVQVRSGRMDNFSYLIFCPETREGLGIDPSLAPENLLEAARERDVKILIVANTHGHGDHIGGNALVLSETGARLAAHPLDLPGADILLEEGSELTIGNGKVTVFHTPGHSPGSITFYIPGSLITGDTLFVTAVGRADLSGSDPEALFASLRRLASFPPETRIYPGHDYGPQPVSTVAYEKDNNPYLQCQDLESFLRLRLG